MSISVIDNFRKRFAPVAEGPQPDVAPVAPRLPLKVRAAKTSAALSHVAVIGLGAIALQTRPDLLTALAGPKALPFESAGPAAALTTAPVTRPPGTVSPAASAPEAAKTPSNVVAPVKRVPPPKVTLAAANEPREIHPAATAPTETELKSLPLTVARGVALPEARLVIATAAQLATLQALPMRQRARDIIRDRHRVRHVKVREGDVTALVAVAATPPVVTPAAKPVTAAIAPPLTKWAALTPEQRAAANVPVKKSVPYTVANVWTDEQITAARAACVKILKSPDIVSTDAEPVKEGACGAPAPVNVSAIGKPKVQLHPSSMMTCPMVAALDKWMTTKVQPAAIETFGAPVARLISASSYSCRNRYGSATTPLSEHALVNALDLAGFVLADGRTVRVKQDWGPVARDAKKPVETSETTTPENSDAPVKVAIAVTAPSKTGLSMLGGASLAKKTSLKSESAKPDAKRKAAKSDDKNADVKKADSIKADDKKIDTPAAPAKDAAPVKDLDVQRREFLHRVHAGACDVFGTVLGPEANDAHRDHFHFDMKARRFRAYCQ